MINIFKRKRSIYTPKKKKKKRKVKRKKTLKINTTKQNQNYNFSLYKQTKDIKLEIEKRYNILTFIIINWMWRR